MNFTSQICTTREQSERLLALGLKEETADCSWISNTSNITGKTHWRLITGWFEDGDLPAWSLHRLIEIVDTYIEFSPFTGVTFRDGPFISDNANDYDAIIDYIEWLIQKEYFNKDYLEE